MVSTCFCCSKPSKLKLPTKFSKNTQNCVIMKLSTKVPLTDSTTLYGRSDHRFPSHKNSNQDECSSSQLISNRNSGCVELQPERSFASINHINSPINLTLASLDVALLRLKISQSILRVDVTLSSRSWHWQLSRSQIIGGLNDLFVANCAIVKQFLSVLF